MKLTKIVALMTVAAMVFAVLAGCAPSAPAAPAAPAAEPAAPAAEPAAPAAEPAAPAAPAAPAESAAAPAEASGPIKIGLTTMGQASFWDAVAEGVRNVMREGDELIFVEGEHGNAAGQVDIIEDFISQQCDVVLFNPVDADAASSCLDLLEAAGIPVINFDSPCTDMSTVESYCATDNYRAGVIAAEYMMQEHPEGGKAAVLVYESAASCVARVDGFLATVEAASNWEVVANLDGGNTTDAALPVAEDIITANPDVNCIFSGNEEMGLGAYSAIAAAGLDIDIYTVNGGPEAKTKMREDGVDGIWRATAAQSPIKMGEMSMELAYRYLEGETLEAEYLIDPFIVSPANIEQYGQSDWQ